MVDEEMNAYDLLGQVELEEGAMDMCRYFHWRMCGGVREGREIVGLSNQELDKRARAGFEVNVYEDVMAFVRDQAGVVGILGNHFRSEAEAERKKYPAMGRNREVFMYTHRSSNRVLRNHRILERKLID